MADQSKQKYSLGLEKWDGGDTSLLENVGGLSLPSATGKLSLKQQEVVDKWQTHVLQIMGMLQKGELAKRAAGTLDASAQKAFSEQLVRFKSVCDEMRSTLGEEYYNYLEEYTRHRLRRYAAHMDEIIDSSIAAIKRISEESIAPDPEMRRALGFWQRLFGTSRE